MELNHPCISSLGLWVPTSACQAQTLFDSQTVGRVVTETLLARFLKDIMTPFYQMIYTHYKHSGTIQMLKTTKKSKQENTTKLPQLQPPIKVLSRVGRAQKLGLCFSCYLNKRYLM